MPVLGEPGWREHIAALHPRIGVLTFPPTVHIDKADNAHLVENHGAPRFHPITTSEFVINVLLLTTTDASTAVVLGLLKLLSYAGRRERVHGVTIDAGEVRIDPGYVRDDVEHGRNHVTTVPTRSIAPPDFTLDRLVAAMNPDRPTMEGLMRCAALNGWPGDAQAMFDNMCDRADWTCEQAEAGLARAVALGMVEFVASDVLVLHPVHFGQMPAGMLSSTAHTMSLHEPCNGASLVNEDGTLDGEKIANATEPGTTQGSKRKPARAVSPNNRLRQRIDAMNGEMDDLRAEVATLREELAQSQAMLVANGVPARDVLVRRKEVGR